MALLHNVFIWAGMGCQVLSGVGDDVGVFLEEEGVCSSCGGLGCCAGDACEIACLTGCVASAGLECEELFIEVCGGGVVGVGDMEVSQVREYEFVEKDGLGGVVRFGDEAAGSAWAWRCEFAREVNGMCS